MGHTVVLENGSIMMKRLIVLLTLFAVEAQAAHWVCRATKRNVRKQEIQLLGGPAHTRASAVKNAHETCRRMVGGVGFCRINACYFNY